MCDLALEIVITTVGVDSFATLANVAQVSKRVHHAVANFEDAWSKTAARQSGKMLKRDVRRVFNLPQRTMRHLPYERKTIGRFMAAHLVKPGAALEAALRHHGSVSKMTHARRRRSRGSASGCVKKKTLLLV